MPPKRPAKAAALDPAPGKKRKTNAQDPIEPPSFEPSTSSALAVGPLYDPLPEAAQSSSSSTPFTPTFIKSIIAPTQDFTRNYDSKLKNKVLVIDNPPTDETVRAQKRDERVKKRRRKKDKIMSSRERKALGVFDVPKEVCKLAKADLHGAKVAVTQSKCPTNIGISGILIRETETMFYIVTEADALKAIPKRNHIFVFPLRDQLITVYGNHFAVRSGERIAKKFRSKPTVELV
ncbi:RNase P/RNase MRP complex subunit [Rhizophlyctis rosea]|nr:RNase P/RNase MRP complex subunit [Rhizophlyctis rosea]